MALIIKAHHSVYSLFFCMYMYARLSIYVFKSLLSHFLNSQDLQHSHVGFARAFQEP